MTMTRKEAIEYFESLLKRFEEMYETETSYWGKTHAEMTIEATRLALSALRHQIWEDQLWHDAKTDPPKTPGLYYGKKDATNSMYACQYRDGVWVLDMYPQQKMDIVQWADYTAFAREGE